MKGLLKCAAIAALVLAGCQSNRNFPEGVAYAGPARQAAQVRFLRDTTWEDDSGARQVDQQIFDAVLETIGQAERLIVLDMFLYNDFQGPTPETTRPLSAELTEALLARKVQRPEIKIVVITDPVNTLYGGLPFAPFQRLEAAGIEVVVTDLTKLPDSNPAWSIIWRPFIQPFGNSPGGILPNPIGPGKVSFRSYFALFNFKANHRKTLIADKGDGYVAIVSSANPHDGSSAHRNAAIVFDGPAVADLLTTENAVLRFSGAPAMVEPLDVPQGAGELTVQIVTEREIGRAVLAELEASAAGDEVRLMMFYLSDRDVIAALKRANERGATVRLILDPNKDAFGRTKSGIPNRPVADELVRAGIPVRWCNTLGEQCHAKMLITERADGGSTLISGSANFTRRNLDNFNLETDIIVRGPRAHPALAKARQYFETSWENPADKAYSLDYEVYADRSWWQRLKYRFMEGTGFSAF